MSASTPRHRRRADSTTLRRVRTGTLAIGLGALSAAGVTTFGAPVAESSSSSSSGVSPVVLTAPDPVMAPVRVSCEPDADARFDDPSHPNRITNKACGYRDADGRTRSVDPWIAEQLAAAS